MITGPRIGDNTFILYTYRIVYRRKRAVYRLVVIGYCYRNYIIMFELRNLRFSM